MAIDIKPLELPANVAMAAARALHADCVGCDQVYPDACPHCRATAAALLRVRADEAERWNRILKSYGLKGGQFGDDLVVALRASARDLEERGASQAQTQQASTVGSGNSRKQDGVIGQSDTSDAS